MYVAHIAHKAHIARIASYTGSSYNLILTYSVAYIAHIAHKAHIGTVAHIAYIALQTCSFLNFFIWYLLKGTLPRDFDRTIF